MKRLFLAVVMVFSLCSHAQRTGQALVDSLLKVLPQKKNDTDKVKLLNLLADTYKTIDPNEGIRYGLQELELANSLGLKKAVAASYNVLGLNYYYKSSYTRALEYYNKALLFYADHPNSGPYGSVISHLAVVYQEMGNYDKALEYNLKSLELDKRIKDSVNIGGDYGNIGILYLLKKDFNKALEYDFKSLDIFTQIGDKVGIAQNYGNIGNVYKEMNDLTKALEYDTRSYEQLKDIGDKAGMAINLGNIGGVYLAIAKEMDTARHSGRTLPPGSKGIFLAKSIENLRQSIDLSKQIGQLDNIIEFSGGLYEAYLLAGNTAAALEAFKQHVTFKDSVYSEGNKMKIAALETERELMLKDKQIQIEKLQVAQKRNERIILIITIVLLLIVMAIGVRKFQAQKKRNAELASEKKRHLDRIEKQKVVMGDIAYTHSHEVSGQVSTILGLVAVFNLQDYTDPDNRVVLEGIAETAEKLDDIVKEMIVKENQLNNSDAKFR